jgi:mycothiol synthase
MSRHLHDSADGVIEYSHSLLLLRPSLDDIPARTAADGYELRLARTEDEPAIAATLTAAFEPTSTQRQVFDVARVRRELTEAPDVDATFVAVWQGTAVATASSRWLPERFPDAGYVHWVGTDPAHKRRGLAGALLGEVFAHFAKVGRTHAVLETEDHRLPALHSYLRLGFTPVYEVSGEDHRPRWSTIFQALV